MSNVSIAVHIRELRKASKWTLAELSAKAAISKSYLSDIEHGRTEPTLETLRKIASAMGYTLSIEFHHGGGDKAFVVVKSEYLRELLAAAREMVVKVTSVEVF